jgi:hypothetical protein
MDRFTVAEQRDLGQVADTVAPHMLNGDPYVLKRHARVEQPLGDLQNQDILERVQPHLAGFANRRYDQASAGPVVELPVCDPDHLTGGRAAEADELAGQRAVELISLFLPALGFLCNILCGTEPSWRRTFGAVSRNTGF